MVILPYRTTLSYDQVSEKSGEFLCEKIIIQVKIHLYLHSFKRKVSSQLEVSWSSENHGRQKMKIQEHREYIFHIETISSSLEHLPNR